MSQNYTIVNGELYHYGIKGQKWGRRRYQNPDGSLTPEGKKRYDENPTGPGDVEAAKQKMKAARHTPEYKDAKLAYKIVKKNYNNSVKAYAEEVRRGESLAWQILARATGIDRALGKAHLYKDTATYKDSLS